MKTYRSKTSGVSAALFSEGDDPTPILEMLRLAGHTAVFVGATPETISEDGMSGTPARSERISYWRDADNGYYVTNLVPGTYIYTTDGYNYNTLAASIFEESFEEVELDLESTLQEVYDVMEANGVFMGQATDIVTGLLNAGILFRKRQ